MWIKICGVTSVADAAGIHTAGASAVGLNFFPDSKRFIKPESALLIVEALSTAADVTGIPRPDVVGVFVNSPTSDIVRIVQTVGLDAVQFHGDETSDDVTRFHDACPETLLIRAFRVSAERMSSTLEVVDQLASKVPLAACLLDAWVPGEFGGTGHRVCLTDITSWFETPRPRLILAGGLNPTNVSDVATDRRLWGLDTASGVESSPGRKDLKLVQDFVQAINLASRTKPDFIRDSLRNR